MLRLPRIGSFGNKPSVDSILSHVATGDPAHLEFVLDGLHVTRVVLTHFRLGHNLAPDLTGYALLWGHELEHPDRPIEIHYSIADRHAERAMGAPIAKLVFAMLQQATTNEAITIKIQRREKSTVVLFLVGENWTDAMTIPNNLQEAMFIRFRTLADLNGPYRENKGYFVLAFKGQPFGFSVREDPDELSIFIDLEGVAQNRT